MDAFSKSVLEVIGVQSGQESEYFTNAPFYSFTDPEHLKATRSLILEELESSEFVSGQMYQHWFTSAQSLITY